MVNRLARLKSPCVLVEPFRVSRVHFTAMAVSCVDEPRRAVDPRRAQDSQGGREKIVEIERRRGGAESMALLRDLGQTGRSRGTSIRLCGRKRHARGAFS